MQPSHYFDDPETGLSRETSHPRFVELAPEDFYYDCVDDFSPFGSDDGNDTLSALEEWYRDGGDDGQVSTFLNELLEDWDFGLPGNLIRADAEAIEKWLAIDDMHENYLQAECRARVATAFGQLKITGRIAPDILDESLAAIRCQLWINERARTHYPKWEFADEAHASLVKMQAVLKRL
jgi:uncharacterized protein YfeS